MPYSKETTAFDVDVTKCFQDDFKEPNQQHVLNVVSQVDTFHYPKDIVRICIDYVRAVVREDSDSKMTIDSDVTLFFIGNQ